MITRGANLESKHDFFCDMWGAERGLTALIVAARHDHVECMDVLLAAGADVNAVEVNGATALTWAAFPGHLGAVKRLLADPRIDIEKGFAGPLWWAAWESRPEVAAALIAAGAKVKDIGLTYSAYGGNPLSVCIAKHQECDDNSDTLATLELLVKAGAEINGNAEHSAMSPLMHALMLPASSELKIPIVTLLVNAGCDCNLLSPDGMSPLHYAVRADDAESVKILLEKGGANIHLAIQSTGYTPYDLAVFNAFDQVSSILASYGAVALDTASPGVDVILVALAQVASCPDPIPNDVLQELRLFHHQLTTASLPYPDECVRHLVSASAYQLFGEHRDASESFAAAKASAEAGGHATASQDCQIRLAISQSFENAADPLDLQLLLRQVYIDFLSQSPCEALYLSTQGAKSHPLFTGIQTLSGLAVPQFHHRKTPATRAELYELCFLDSTLWDDLTNAFFAHLKGFLKITRPASRTATNDSIHSLYADPIFTFVSHWVKYFRGSHSGSEYFISERKGATIIVGASSSSSVLWETLSLAIAYLAEWKRLYQSEPTEQLDTLLSHLFANCSNFSRCAPLRDESVSTMICATLLDFRQKVTGANTNLSFAAGVALASLSLSLPLQQQKAQLETLSHIIEYLLDRLTLARLGKRLPDDPPEDNSVNNPRYNDWLVILAALCTSDTNRKMAWDGDLMAQLDNHHSAENPRRAKFLAMKLPPQIFSPASRLYIRPALTDGTAELLMDHLIRLRTVFEIYWSFAFDKAYLDVLLKRHVPDHIIEAWNAANSEKPVHGTPRTIPQFVRNSRYNLIWEIASRLEKTVVNVLWQLGEHDARKKLLPLPKLEATRAALRRSLQASIPGIAIEEPEPEPEDDEPKGVKLSGPWIMISYNWGHQETVLEFREALRANGFPVWIDVEQMNGSTLEAMAEAVEGAAVILMCMSKAYQASRNCRSEAEYAFTMKKPIIPIKMEEFQPEGWLGFILGSKLYFQMKKEDETSISDFTVRQICREIQRHVPAAAPAPPKATASHSKSGPSSSPTGGPKPATPAPVTRAEAHRVRSISTMSGASASSSPAAAPPVVFESHPPPHHHPAPHHPSPAPVPATCRAPAAVSPSFDSSPISWSPQQTSQWLAQIGLRKMSERAVAEGYSGYFLYGIASLGRWTDAKIHQEIMANLGLSWMEFVILIGALHSIFPLAH